MKTYPLLLFVFCITLGVFQSCKTEDESLTETISSASLRNLEVGQKISYRKIQVDFKPDSTTNNFDKTCSYGDDILILEVIEKTTNGYTVKEYLSTQNAADVGTLSLTINDNTVDIMQLEDPAKYGPSLFHQKTFDITPIDSPEGGVEEDCFHNQLPSSGDTSIGFSVTSATINKVNYDNLYVYRFDGAMAVDGPGASYLFDKNAAIIRSTTYGGFFPFLEGWEIISE